MGYGAGEGEGHADVADLHPLPHLREASDRTCRPRIAHSLRQYTLPRAIREWRGGAWGAKGEDVSPSSLPPQPYVTRVSRASIFLAREPHNSASDICEGLPSSGSHAVKLIQGWSD